MNWFYSFTGLLPWPLELIFGFMLAVLVWAGWQPWFTLNPRRDEPPRSH